MNIESIKQYTEYIRNYNIRNNEDIQVLANIVKQLAKDYDEKVNQFKYYKERYKTENLVIYKTKYNEIYDSLKLEMMPIIEFSHKYSEYMLGFKDKSEIRWLAQPNNGAPAFYNDQSRSVTYDISQPWETSLELLGTPMHELRHKFQYNHIYYQNSSIEYDPMFIVIAKEWILKNKGIDYHSNHENFISENDANLYGKYMLKQLNTQFLGNLYDDNSLSHAFALEEQNNYSNYTNGDILSDMNDVSYNGAENNNRLISTDKIVKQRIKENPQLLRQYPIMQMIYHMDGSPKNYQEIISEREKMLEEHKDNKSLNTNAYSYSNYNQKNLITEKEQIDNLFKAIISSDPILWIEDCLNKKAYNRLNSMLEDNELIVDEYKSDFIEIINKYNDGTPIFNKLLSTLGTTSNSNEYENMLNQINNTQSKTSDNLEPEIVDYIPDEINELFIKYVYENYKEIIGYDNLSYEEIYEAEEQIKQGINPAINKEIFKLKKAYIEAKKSNPEIGYSDLVNHLYPQGEFDELEQTDVVDSVEGHKIGHR